MTKSCHNFLISFAFCLNFARYVYFVIARTSVEFYAPVVTHYINSALYLSPLS